MDTYFGHEQHQCLYRNRLVTLLTMFNFRSGGAPFPLASQCDIIFAQLAYLLSDIIVTTSRTCTIKTLQIHNLQTL